MQNLVISIVLYRIFLELAVFVEVFCCNYFYIPTKLFQVTIAFVNLEKKRFDLVASSARCKIYRVQLLM